MSGDVRFEKFEIGKLFKAQTGDIDLQQKDINGKGVYFINSGVENKGIKGKTDRMAKVFSSNTITVDFWGNAYYRDFEYKMATHNHVFSLSGDVIKNKEVGLYIVSTMGYMKNIFSYGYMGTWNKIKKLHIILPILIENNTTAVIDKECKYHKMGYIPDFAYMEEYIVKLEKERISELEKERIAELEKYLTAAGLNDYELTEEDKKVLSFLETKDDKCTNRTNIVTVPKQVRYFRCGDLFDIHPTNAYKLSNIDLYKTKGNNRIISNTSVNNGVGGYCGLNNTEKGGIITFSDTTVGAETMFYQPDDFIGYAHVQGMYPKDRENWKEQQLKYFIAVMRRASGEGWSYAQKFNRKLVANMTLELPIKTDENSNPIIDTTHKYHKDGYIPDFLFMKKYIKAVEKVVIADVVKYKDEVIEKTKEIVNSGKAVK